MQKYVDHIRPHSEGNHGPYLFPTRDGKKIDHLSRHVNALALALQINLPSTATQTRHAAATAVSEGTDTERSAVATTMSHS